MVVDVLRYGLVAAPKCGFGIVRRQMGHRSTPRSATKYNNLHPHSFETTAPGQRLRTEVSDQNGSYLDEQSIGCFVAQSVEFDQRAIGDVVGQKSSVIGSEEWVG